MTESLTDFIDAVQSAGLNVKNDLSGAMLTTYRVGGPIAHCVSLTSRDDINSLAGIISSHFVGQLNDRNVVTIGKGSNLLVDDQGFSGCVFRLAGELAEFNGSSNRIDDQIRVTVGGGVPLPTFARQCVPEAIAGLEFYVGIPGSVGGAVAMNAGGHGKQTSDVLVSCNVLNLSSGIIERFSNESCHFSYRHSRFRLTDIIYSAQFEGKEGDPARIKRDVDSIVQWRREHQPGGRNVGSVFQNPPDISAGELIDKCELKGFRIGGAYVSEKHANFILSDEGATAADVYAVIEHIRTVVFESTGYKLDTEVRHIGKYDNESR